MPSTILIAYTYFDLMSFSSIANTGDAHADVIEQNGVADTMAPAPFIAVGREASS